jgi:hypothetical protein
MYKHQACVTALLEAKATAGTSDNIGLTPFHAAAQGGDVGCMDALLEAGAKVEEPANSGAVPLHTAVAAEQVDGVIALLKAKAAVDPVANTGHTPLAMAVSKGNKEIIAILTNAGADAKAVARLGSGYIGQYQLLQNQITGGRLESKNEQKVIQPLLLEFAIPIVLIELVYSYCYNPHAPTAFLKKPALGTIGESPAVASPENLSSPFLTHSSSSSSSVGIFSPAPAASSFRNEPSLLVDVSQNFSPPPISLREQKLAGVSPVSRIANRSTLFSMTTKDKILATAVVAAVVGVIVYHYSK